MGMFDTFFIEKKLPLPAVVKDLKIDWKKEAFQTKDLECLMNLYKVNRSGQLFTLFQEREWVEDSGRFGGHLNTISERWIKSNHTGKVLFYTTVCSNPEQKENDFFDFATKEQIDGADGFDYSLDFEAKFVDGKIKDLKFIRVDVYPIKEYLITHNKWVAARKEKGSKLSYKIKNFFQRTIPNRGYFKIINSLNKFIHFQQKIISKLY